MSLSSGEESPASSVGVSLLSLHGTCGSFSTGMLSCNRAHKSGLLDCSKYHQMLTTVSARVTTMSQVVGAAEMRASFQTDEPMTAGALSAPSDVKILSSRRSAKMSLSWMQ